MQRFERINQLLSQALEPVFLEILDESGNHSVPEGSESHFKVTLVSACFATDSRVARHRRVNHLLAHEFDQGLHALSLHLYTPEEWEVRARKSMESPLCRGGSRRD